MKQLLLTFAPIAISKSITKRLLKLSPLLFIFCSLTGYAQCGYINTVAGNGTAGYSGDGGAATSAELNLPYFVAVDASGNIYIADYDNNRIRKVTASTGNISTVAGNGTAGYSGDGGAAISAELNIPVGIAVDTSGNIYIVDGANNRIRKVTASTGQISTIAGNGTAGYSGDGGAAISAELDEPNGVAVDASGNIYIADHYNQCIRKVTASTGLISTVAGNGTQGYLGDGGAATSAELHSPDGVAVDASGNIYIADQGNNRIRKVSASTGIISTVAGNGTGGYSGDGSVATSAELDFPYGVAVDASGNIYIADFDNHRIRKVTFSTGFISTIAGTGTAGYSGDGGPAISAKLNFPSGVAVGAFGNVYIADHSNNRIREITTAPNLSITGTMAGCSSVTLTATGGTSYAWSGGSSPNAATNTFSSSGTYTVTATNNGCTATASKVVTVNTQPTAGITGTATGCGQVSLTATGNGTYAWSGGSSPNTAANTFTTGGTYTVTVTNNGCTATASQVVTVNTIPSPGITGTATGCGQVSLTATGGGTYAWSGGSTPNTAANTFTNSATYTVTVTNNSCTATASQAVTVNTIPTATITPSGSTTFCQGDSVTLTASAGAQYLWSSSATSQNIHVSQTGNYTVAVTSANNCSASSTVTAVTVNALPNAQISGPTTTCSGLTDTLIASGGTGYSWNNSLGSNAKVTVQPTGTTTYVVTVTNSNSCSATASQTVTVTNTPTATISGTGQLCSGNNDTLTANGGNSYAWSGGLGSNATIQVSPTNTTTYTVTATIGANCSATASQTVTVFQRGASQFSHSTCAGEAYNFNNQNLTTGGIYYDTLQTIHGCDSIVTLNLTVNNGAQTTLNDTACNGTAIMFKGQSITTAGVYKDTLQTMLGCDSIVTLTLLFDSLPQPTVTRSGDTLQTQVFVSYQWLRNGFTLNDGTTQSVIIQQNGNYTVVVTGQNGCSDTSAVLSVTTLGVQNVMSAYGVKLYPNPNTGSFILEFTDDIVRDAEITDAVGRTVMASVKVSRQQNFNLEELSAGIYIVRINQEGQVQSMKFTLVR